MSSPSPSSSRRLAPRRLPPSPFNPFALAFHRRLRRLVACRCSLLAKPAPCRSHRPLPSTRRLRRPTARRRVAACIPYRPSLFRPSRRHLARAFAPPRPSRRRLRAPAAPRRRRVTVAVTPKPVRTRDPPAAAVAMKRRPSPRPILAPSLLLHPPILHSHLLSSTPPRYAPLTTAPPSVALNPSAVVASFAPYRVLARRRRPPLVDERPFLVSPRATERSEEGRKKSVGKKRKERRRKGKKEKKGEKKENN